MKIKYLGHASFVLELGDGRTIIFDPYESGAYNGALAYSPITGSFDVAVVSHEHADHRDTDVISRSKNVVEDTGEFEFDGIRIKSFSVFHDESEGRERGRNRISIVEADGLRVAHLGDLGHRLSDTEAANLKGVDVAFVPVGGHFTIGAEAARDVVIGIDPRIVIPMHFKTPKVDFPIKGVEDFVSLMDDVERIAGSEFVVNAKSLPEKTKVVVLDPAN